VATERSEFIPAQTILHDLRTALEALGPDAIDWVSFVGSGEPTLHSRLGYMIRQAVTFTPTPVAVITNGSLLHLQEVRDELMAADAVLPSLDAGSDALYRVINRAPHGVAFERIVDGLRAFASGYSGHLWVEVMLVAGMNDTEDALRDLATTLRYIGPDEVHVTLPTRPPAEEWVTPAEQEGLMRATAILGESAKIVHPSQGSVDLAGYADAAEAVLGVIARHPMRQEELARALTRWDPQDLAAALEELESSGRATVVNRHGYRFWTASEGRYADSPRRSRS
jgi:wyosine [tRNA(Phe)-imidazoG37] synthetase (radical SAM superfamily)